MPEEIKTDKVKLWAKNLKKYFQTQKNPLMKLIRGHIYVKAVDDVSFDIREGEVFGLVGESGSGKTTVGENVLMLQEPTDGKLYYEINTEIKKKIEWLERQGKTEELKKYDEKYSLTERENLDELRKDIQIIFQDPSASLNPAMTVFETIKHPVDIHDLGSTKKEKEEIVYDIMEEVGLSPPSRFKDVYPPELSGGQKQRVVIARAMVLNPSFIVADEPVAMLDMSIRARILNLLMSLKEELGLTFLLITHDLATAKFVCNRIGIMYLGKIVEIGDADEIFKDPKHPYTKTLMETIPRADPRKRTEERTLPKGEIPDPINAPKGCRFHPRCLQATPDCGWSPRDLENYIDEHLLDIYSEEEISELKLNFKVDEEDNALLIPKKERIWDFVRENLDSDEPIWKAVIDHEVVSKSAVGIGDRVKAMIKPSEPDEYLKVKFKEIDEPELEQEGNVKVACVLYQ